MSTHDERDTRVQAYLDGLLDDHARRQLEQDMVDDGRMADLVRRQRSVDDELRRTFTVPGGLDERVADAVRRASAPRRAASSGPGWPALLQAAAAVLIAVGLGSWWSSGGGDPMGPPLPGVLPADVEGLYASVVEQARSTPANCNVEGDLGSMLTARFGCRIEVTPGVPLAGPFTCEGWPTATALAALVEPDPVVLLLDVAHRDPGLTSAGGGSLGVHRREEGPLVLYELSYDVASCLSVLSVDVELTPPER